MDKLSYQIIPLIERISKLEYESEYLPLINAANKLKEYEETGMEPIAIECMQDAFGRGLTIRSDAAERLEIIAGIKTEQLKQMVALFKK